MASQWTEVAIDMQMYLIFAGLTQAALTVGIAILSTPLLLRRGWPAYRAFVTRVLLFSALLYAWGCIGDGLFVAAFRDRIYVNRDPIGNFIPWFPSTRYIVDTACGGRPINGATWNTLRLAWVAVAVPVWLAAFWSYARLMRFRGDSRIARLRAAESR
jgi:ABC-type glycerol-3-phosphate transport system permease component